jgi:hypothetical protein
MLHSTSWLSSCVNPCFVHAEINAAEAKVMEITGDWGPAVDMQGYGWALLVGPEDAWDRFGRSTMARVFFIYAA